jgi:cobyrinic acid a,c-diamide synthase
MALGRAIIGQDGKRYPMLDLLGLETSFAERRLHLGYRRAELLSDCLLGAAGLALTGHEFHYASVMSAPDEPLFRVSNAEDEPLPERGSRRGHITGSFFHVLDCCNTF